MKIYSKDNILSHWDMKTYYDNFESYKIFDNAIITKDSCFSADGSLINFSPLRRSSIDWKKVQVYPTPVNPIPYNKIDSAYYINFFHSSHWGHFLTESLGRMNSLLCDKVPTKNIIIRFEHTKSIEWIKSIPQLSSYNIIPFDNNYLVQKLYLPIPTMVNFHYIVGEHIDTLQKYGEHFSSTIDIIPKKVYLSRSKLPKTHRYSANENSFESELKKYGWDIIHIQDYTIGDQIKILSNAKYLLGCMGSAFHNLMMCKNVPEKIIYLTPDINYIFPNYAAHDTLMGSNSLFMKCLEVTDHSKRNYKFIDPINTTKIIEGLI
jgi:capsular polysaccharide biosynthesis protein